MKAKVIKRFRDKLTRDIHVIDSEYEGKEKRVKELQKLGYLEDEMEPKTPEEPKELSILDGNVGEVTEAITDGLGRDVLEKLLQREKKDKNRKGVIEYIESLLAD